MSQGLGWARTAVESVEREIEAKGCDGFLKQASLTSSYKITDFTEEELAQGNDHTQAPGVFQECDAMNENEVYWEGCKSMSVNEYLEKEELAGVRSDDHHVFCVQHCQHSARQFVVLQSPVAVGEEMVFTSYWCTCGGGVQSGVPCRHFLSVYREQALCGFHCGMFHPMWWVKSRTVESQESTSAFPLLQASSNKPHCW